MEDLPEYTIDKSTIDSLSSDTRVLILSSLRDRQKTNAELSRELSLKPPTIHHHIERLKDAGLVESSEDGHKWIYYRLTKFGEALFNPDKKMKLSIILSAILTGITGLAAVITYITMPRLSSGLYFPILDDPFFLMFIVTGVSLSLQALILIYVFRRETGFRSS